jgi:pimeloyl-ACP methyl ester carboxylesterase
MPLACEVRFTASDTRAARQMHPLDQRQQAPHAPAARHSLRSAMAVVWSTIGMAPSGPRGGRDDLRELRRTVSSDTDARPLSYLAAGHRSHARLLLVHGTPGSARGWAQYLQRPPAGFEVLAPDRPGFGASGPDTAVTSLAAQARSLATLLPDDDRPAVVLGHSLGAAVAARLAADHPGRVGALILLAAALDPVLEQVHPLQRVGCWPVVRALLPRAIRNANAELLALRDELVDLAAALGRVRCPVFIVHGTDDDLVPVANVRYAQQRLRGAAQVTTRLLPGHNHFLPWNAPLELRRVIAAAGSAAC